MASIGGFEIGSHALHIAVAAKGKVQKAVSEPLPEGAVREGRVTSYEALADFIKETCKKNKVRVGGAAVVLPGHLCICRRMTSPVMTHEQLMINLPYEFRDFITTEKDAYYYDYAVLAVNQDPETGEPRELDLMAAACLKSTVQTYRDMFRRAGIKLRTAVPIEIAYANLFSGVKEEHAHCLIDLGHTAVRMYMYHGKKYENTHTVEYGMSALDEIIADRLHIDPFVAASYREANHDDCQSLPECREVYQNLANEVQRAVYFFRYNNPDVELEHIHLSGGGARIGALRQVLEGTLSIPIQDCSELIGETPAENLETALGAAGAALQ